ncbi:DNA topoisomerase 3 [Spirochaetota bacterium]|nr:DNA topoisomerase 3 [Spirochaetota bacterium]
MEKTHNRERTLVIAEKPSVARDITRCLKDKFKKEDTHFEGEHYIVSYALGHLLTIAEPGEIDEKFKSWKLTNLPFIPKTYNLKPIKNNKNQLSVLKKLVTLPDVTTIINACDAGREGELIFQYIMDYIAEREPKLHLTAESTTSAQKPAPAQKTIKRLWLQSMTDKSIKEAFQKLRSHSEMKPLSDAAKSRSEADWLVGINSTRGLTSFKSKGGGFFLTPCGRVQTPTLSMLIEREKAIEAFKPEPYQTLSAEFLNGSHSYEGKWIDPQFKKSDQNPHERADRLFDPKKTKTIIENCTRHYGIVTETAKEVSENCPLLYDLTTLQREANTRFSYSAKRTLAIMQSLYERHKMLTYPRTSSRYLPEDYLDEVKKVFKNLASAELARNIQKFAAEAIAKDYLKTSRRIFDNKKVSDHHAIIPTEKTNFKSLNDDEKKIYTIVVERFIGIFFPSAKSLKTVRLTTVRDEVFKTEGKIMLKPGWKAIAGRLEEDKILHPLEKALPNPTSKPKAPPQTSSANDYVAYCEKVEALNLETKPPGRYSEASLLSAMESAGKVIDDKELSDAIKEKGIGTPATRAAIIEKLIYDKYIFKQDRQLIPTSKAFELFTLIATLEIEELTSPELTGDWEYKLRRIEKGELSRKDFMNQITDNTKKIVSHIQNYNEEENRSEASFSPINGEKFYKHATYYTNENQSMTIRAIIAGRRMKDDEIATLIKNRKVGPFSDFRSRKGVPFPATVTLNDAGKVEIVFLNNEEDLSLDDLKQLPLVGKLHSDQSNVYQTDHAFISESYLDKKPTGIRINRFILGKEITEENMSLMISGKKSNLIQGFRSNKTKRLFDAYLEINKDSGKIQFSFPPRKTKGKKAAAKDISDTSDSSKSEKS